MMRNTALISQAVPPCSHSRPAEIPGAEKRRSRPAFRISKGTLLVAHIGYIHQRVDHFENPTAFQPERFIGKRPEINYYAPFGGGLHSCIGNHFAALEVRVFLKVMFGKGEFVCKRRAEREKRQTILNLPAKGVRVVFKGLE